MRGRLWFPVLLGLPHGVALNSWSTFHGRLIELAESSSTQSLSSVSPRCTMTMRKQKSSDRRTRRKQREVVDWQNKKELRTSFPTTVAASPMQAKDAWNHRRFLASANDTRTVTIPTSINRGRGRSQRRLQLYRSLSFYHNKFLHLLTQEYQAEEDEILDRIKSSLDAPLELETAGFALYDMYPSRRGNLFGDEVYRITKATDATTSFPRSGEVVIDNDTENSSSTKSVRYLPQNLKFLKNDVVMITLQPRGSGDFLDASTLPISNDATRVEARVLNTGPTYVDISVPTGKFAAAFGSISSHTSVRGDSGLRVRADRFVSIVPYQRMVAAISQLTSIPDRLNRPNVIEGGHSSSLGTNSSTVIPVYENIHMDEILREAILSTHAYSDPNSPIRSDPKTCDLTQLAASLARPPMHNSYRLMQEVMKIIQTNPEIFREFNSPQKAAIEAALTRRMTMIQGPPGSGKTCVASAIGFGFVHQCRSLSPNTKTLACAFSNVGADNLAEAFVRLGINIVRIGKCTAISESLWDYTLEAAIHRDPDAQMALRAAEKATALVEKNRKSSFKSATGQHSGVSGNSKILREVAANAVKASIIACNIAATKHLRKVDVIVSTSTGAANPRLLAACGITIQETGTKSSFRPNEAAALLRLDAPDGLPPVSLPFVIIDEACQSVEPASLIPIVSFDSCRSLVMLGDPCQLPPTVKTLQSSPLSLSLMERLSALLPSPNVNPLSDSKLKDRTFLDTLPIKQAKEIAFSLDSRPTPRSYRKGYTGSLLLNVQYRMHPSIAAFPSAIFYNGQLSTPASLAFDRRFPLLSDWMPCGNLDMGVRVIDVGGRSNERQGVPTRHSRTVFGKPSSSVNSALSCGFTMEKTTYWNEAEAERVVVLIREIVERDGKNSPRSVDSIGVVSPYTGQVQLINSIMSRDDHLRDLLCHTPVSIEVKSVDGYQGRERDVIIFSAVRSNHQGKIGFLHDWRRLNVALTRAKLALLVVGDFDTLSENDRHWAAFTRWAIGSRCLMHDYDGIR